MVSRATPTTATKWSPIEKVIQFTTLALFLVDKPKMVKRQRQVKSARIGNHDGGLGKSRKRRKKVKGMSEKEVACLHLHVLRKSMTVDFAKRNAVMKTASEAKSVFSD